MAGEDFSGFLNNDMNAYNPSPQPTADMGGGGGGSWWNNLFGGGSGGSSVPGTPAPQDQGSGFGRLGMNILGSTLPALLGAGAGYGFNSLMPGKATLTDTRNPQQRQTSQMGLSSLTNLQNNPNSFGLPGDPEDVNSPAGRKLYGIRQESRSADAARGMFNTGGSVQRENNAVTDASNSAFQGLQRAYSGQAQAGPGQTLTQKQNPWAQLLGGITSPAVAGLTSGIMRNFGFTSSNPWGT